MAEYSSLKEFLTDIANAIRTKKGTTDKILPKNFAEEINGIEFGSGGGSLSSGVYFKPQSKLPYNFSNSRLFTFNGELYLWCVTKNYYAKIYKYENSEFIEVCDVPISTTSTTTTTTELKKDWGVTTNFIHDIIEYKGKVYFRYASDVCTWDGTTFTIGLTTPKNSSKYSMAIYNNELYYFVFSTFGSRTTEIYKFNDTTNTFDLVNTVTYDSSKMGRIFENENDVYMILNDYTIHKFNGTSFDLVTSNLPSIDYNYLIPKGNILYLMYSHKNGCRFYKYNFDTNEYTQIEYLPFSGLNNVIKFNDEIHITSGVTVYDLHFVFYEVE